MTSLLYRIYCIIVIMLQFSANSVGKSIAKSFIPARKHFKV